MHNRHSIRLRGYDYGQKGLYFVTICTQDRENVFGEIRNKKMELNDVGKMVQQWLIKICNKYPHVDLYEFQIMPNHIHVIIKIVGVDLGVDPEYVTVGTIIQWFKTMTTNEYIRCVKNNHWVPFNRRFWQRNFYEHIIRNEESLKKIRDYIKFNPENWEKDKDNHPYSTGLPNLPEKQEKSRMFS